MLHIVVNHFRSDRTELVHREFLVLWLDGDGSILDHESQMVQGYPDYEHWYVVSDGACLKQVDREIKSIVVI